MTTLWIYPLLLAAGALQAFGPPMNGALRHAVTNPWLASFISFFIVTALLACLCLVLPRPMPSVEGIARMPWWAPLGGVIGAFAVVAALMFVDKVGAGSVNGLVITANILASLALDHFGWFNMPEHSLRPMRVLGGLLMVGGVALINLF